MDTTILALDLGKFNSVLCWYEPDTHAAAFAAVRTSAAELRRELTRRPVAVVAFEACSRSRRHGVRGPLGETMLFSGQWPGRNLQRNGRLKRSEENPRRDLTTPTAS